jgi:diguanylate cyclase (GGDEF)-like protein
MNCFISLMMIAFVSILMRDKYICPGAKYWMAGLSSYSLGLIFIAIRIVAPLWISVLFGNGLIISGIALLLLGLIRYRRPLHHMEYTLLIIGPATGCAMVICYWAGVAEQSRGHIFHGVALLLLLANAIAGLYQRKKDESGRVIYTLSVSFVLLCIILRIIYQAKLNHQVTILENSPGNAILFLSSTLGVLGIGFSILLMATQWSQRRIRQVANRDELTGLYNRHGLTVRSSELDRIYHIKHERFSVAIIDIDFFKSINDTYGHVAGDRVLQEIARRIRTNIRSEDILARYGGEEFLVILPCLREIDAVSWAERIREVVSAEPVRLNEQHIPVTMSIGITETGYQEIRQKFEAVVQRADQALYWAKEHGRDKVCSFERRLA